MLKKQLLKSRRRKPAIDQSPHLEPIESVISRQEAGELYRYYDLLAAGGYIHEELLPCIAQYLLSKVDNRVNEPAAS